MHEIANMLTKGRRPIGLVRVLLIALLVLMVPASGCLRELGQGLGLAGEDSDPWVQPSLEAATIRPGMGVGNPPFCTSNFLFLDADLATVYLGTAAHCVTSDSDPLGTTNGCDASRHPLEPERVALAIEGGGQAVLAYNSWWSMQQDGATGAECAGNDFALLRLSSEDAARAHPSMLMFGGPTGLAGSVAPGDLVKSYGASELLPRPELLDGRQGVITQTNGWTHNALFLTPGVQGDSGSGVIRGDGAAVGILVTVGSNGNGITDLGRAIAFAQTAGMELTLLTAPLEAGVPLG